MAPTFFTQPALPQDQSKIVDRLGVQGVTQSVIQLIVVGSLTTILASVSYAYFETPFLKLKRHFDANNSFYSLQANENPSQN